MVLAVTKPKLVDMNGARIKSRPSRFAMLGAVSEAGRRGEMKASEQDAQKRAQLMSAAKCAVYVSDAVPLGNFSTVDPAALSDGDRLLCPFKVKTLLVHPDDVDRAISHFTAEAAQKGQALQ